MVSNEERQEQGYIDKRQETVFGRMGEGQRESQENLFELTGCAEKTMEFRKSILGKAREFCCRTVFWITEGYCKRQNIPHLDLGIVIYQQQFLALPLGARLHSTLMCFSSKGPGPHKLQDLCSARAFK